MGRIRLNVPLLVATFLMLIPMSNSQLVPRPIPNLPPDSYHPFCLSQFALANHGCAPIRYGPVPEFFSFSNEPDFTLASHPGFIELHHNHHSHGHGHSHSQGHSHSHSHSHNNEHSHGHGHGHSHGHGHNHGHGHSQNHRHHDDGHHHHHRHRHEHHDLETEAARECCKWLKAVNDYCVCDLLVRLPTFLSRPIHGFLVVVEDVCRIEYKCPGRFMTSP